MKPFNWTIRNEPCDATCVKVAVESVEATLKPIFLPAPPKILISEQI